MVLPCPLAFPIVLLTHSFLPKGVFFMYFQSRYYTVTSQTERACEILQDALDLKLEYLQVCHDDFDGACYHCSCCCPALKAATYLSCTYLSPQRETTSNLFPFPQWDMGVNNLVMCNFRKARSCFEILASESSWSKAVYM
jgi:hypothetical protein